MPRESMKILIVELNRECISTLLKKIRISKSRSSFNVHFDDFLNVKLQEKGLNCWLKNKFNYFRGNNNTKNIEKLWSGKYTCIQNGCDNDFSAYILNSNLNEKFDEMDEASIHVRFFDKSSHKDKVKKNIRCAGTEREKQKLFVCSNGLSNTLSENILHNNSIGENGSK